MRETPNDPEFESRWSVLGEPLETSKGFSHNEVNILLVDQSVQVDDQRVSAFPNLRYIITPNTSTEHITADLEKAMVKLIKLQLGDTRLQDVDAVAQFCMRAIYTLARPIAAVGMNLRGKKLCIVGHGRIGQHLNELAYRHGMDILTLDKNHTQEQFMETFKRADFISLHLPAKSCVIGKELLDQMKRTAYLINTSRPSVLDEKYLVELVRNKKIAGAWLDVSNLSADELRTPGITYSAHTAGRTTEDRIKTDKIVIEDALKIIKG
jgi:phosphoglycerate dehydrogenase-like enzyme